MFVGPVASEEAPIKARGEKFGDYRVGKIDQAVFAQRKKRDRDGDKRVNDEQRRVALFQAQPEGLGLFFRPAALSVAYVAVLHALVALLDKKIASSRVHEHSANRP